MPDDSIELVHASGECEIDLARRELRVLGSAVPVGGRAFEIIEVLARSAGELVTKDELMNRVWPGAIVMESTLHVHAAAIRKALGSNRSLLKTESGRGYRLLGDWSVRHHDAVKPPVGLQRMRADGASRVTNFPATVTRLVGRTAAVDRLRDLISAYRIVTLVGPGGIGKTSLALKAARGIVGEFAGGAWLVELAPIADQNLVPPAVAGALGLKPEAGANPAEAVAGAIREKKLLLVLDNCEQVIDATAVLVDMFMRRCPNVTILATSREGLGIQGEFLYRVPALEVPAANETGTQQILGYSAPALFITRAKELGSDLSAEPRNLPTIAAICRHLDGIPLAIEFAAARAATLGVDQVAAALGDRFALLTSGRRTALPRHRTLRATLDWSYQLLGQAEQLLLRHLAVFPAGFTFEAVVAVMRDTGPDPSSVTDGIAGLVTKSLVAIDKSAAATRWQLLETTRVYAHEKLLKFDGAAAPARRHAAFFRDLVVRLAPPSDFQPGSEGLAECFREIDNVRAALDRSFSAAGDIGIGVALTDAYVPVWIHSALLVECRERCERALVHLDELPAVTRRLRLRLQLGLGLTAVYTRWPLDKTRTVLASALDIAQSLNDLEAQHSAISGLWLLHYYSGESRAALALAERLSAAASSAGDSYVRSIADRLIGNSLHHLGDQHGAQARLEVVLERDDTFATRRRSLFPQTNQRVMARGYLSRVLLLRGYMDRAVEQAQRCLEEATATGSELVVFQALRLAVCHAALMTGDLVAAERDIARLLDIANVVNAPLWMSAGRFFKGKLLIAQGAFGPGTTLLRAELDACEKTGLTNWFPEFLGVLAEGLAGLGRFAEALASIDQGLAKADQGGERYYVAELFRLKGEVLLAQSDNEPTAAIDDCFHTALTLARQQGALLFELRAAFSIARWRERQERHDEARQILAPVYDRFTEGFGTPDVRAAKAFLDELPG